jgi:hypothetical protein
MSCQDTCIFVAETLVVCPHSGLCLSSLKKDMFLYTTLIYMAFIMVAYHVLCQLRTLHSYVILSTIVYCSSHPRHFGNHCVPSKP